MIRYAKLRINDVDILHEENGGLYFTCDYNSGKDNEIGSIKISIYNLSQDIKVGSNVSLDFGRNNINGRFGTYKVIKSHKYKNGADKVTELICSEMSNLARKTVSVSLKGQITSLKAIREICLQVGLSLVQSDIKNDRVFNNGFSCFGSAIDELKELAENTSSKMQIKGSDVYFYIDDVKGSMLSLSFDSGLLENPKYSESLQLDKTTNKQIESGEIQAGWESGQENVLANNSNEYDWEVSFLADNSVKKGDMLEVKNSDTFNGRGKIKRLTLSMSERWTMKAYIKGV